VKKKLMILAVLIPIFIIMSGIDSIPLFGTQYLSSNTGSSYSIAPWWDESWGSRKSITINCSQVDNDLTNFPILVNITDTDLKNDSQPDGDDITFIQYGGGIIQLNHEIELYDKVNGHLVAWVNITSLSSIRNTTIYMHYNNSNCDSQENPAGVWDSHFIAVWHMKDNATGNISDSTSHFNNGTKGSGDAETVEADGLAGKCQQFDGGDIINVNGDIYLDRITWDSKPLTIELFANDATDLTNNRVVMSQSNGSSGETSRNWFQVEATTGYWATLLGGSSWVSTYVCDLNSWEHSCIRYNGTQAQWIVNKTYGMLTDKIFNESADGNITIGSHKTTTSTRWIGYIDEIRISDTNRSNAWLNTTYNTIKNTDTFIRVGRHTNTGL